jgi:phage terminase large subunit-like protein
MSVDKVLQHLEQFSPEEQEAIAEALLEKRKRDEFIRWWVPYEYQQCIFEVFIDDPKEIYVLGGNRSGKTMDGGAVATAYLMGKDYFKGFPAWEWVKYLPIPEGRPRQIWVVGLDFSVVKDTILGEYILRGKNNPPMLPHNWEALGFKVKEGDLQIIGPDGSILTLKSAESGREKFQSASVDLVWIDEEPDVSVYEECWQRTADCGGKILVTLTPLVDTASGTKIPWVFQQVTKSREGDKDIAVVSLETLKNPTIPEIEKERLKKKWAGHPEERARLYGEFIQRSGLVYPMLRDGVHFVEPVEIPRTVYRVACIDPAPNGPTACVWGAVYVDPYGNEPGDVRLYKEYKEANLIVSDHAKNILMMNGSDPIDLWIIDPWGGNQKDGDHRTLSQLYRENGIPVRPAELDSDFSQEVAREYFTAVGDPSSRSPKAVIENTLTKLKTELSGYVWDYYGQGAKKGQSKGKPRKYNDHLINCVQYILGMRLKGRRQERKRMNQDLMRERAKLNSYT